MAARALWKGTLEVADLTCPVALMTAVSTSDRIAFHTVNRATGHRVSRQFVDEETGEVVERGDQMKGYATESGDTILVGQEEIAATAPESDKMLHVEHFIRTAGLDPLFFDKPYYLVPSDAVGGPAYEAIRAALASDGVAALATAVLFRRSRTVVVRAEEHGLVATLLAFDYQVRASAEAFDGLKAIKIEKEMLSLAQHIIKTKAGTFDPKAFDDRYENAVAEMVRAKMAGKSVKRRPEPKAAGKVVDLMGALRASLKATEGAGAKPAKTASAAKTRTPAAKTGKPAADSHKRVTRKAS